MDDKQVLLGKSKEELVEIILVQEQRIKTLEEKLSCNKKDPPESVKADTRYRHSRCWRTCCQKIADAPYHKTEVPSSRIGPNALIQAEILKYNHCLPYRKITGVLKELSGLDIGPGALAQSLQRLSLWLNVEQETILEAIRAGPVVHIIDETGWRLDGKNHWLWAFVSEKSACCRIKRSRGRRIVKETLSDDYRGAIITDFYGVYFNLPYKRQKCLAYLLRELRKIAQHDTSKKYQFYYKRIKRLVKDAVNLYDARDNLRTFVYKRRLARIKKRLFMFLGANYENKNLDRISRRFSKYWLDMLTFLEEKGVAWNNNLAERLIRPRLIYRNRSFGNRSQEGLKTHETLTSLIQTLLLQKRSVFESLKTAFIAHKQGEINPLLFASTS
jgi:transposase